VQSSNLQTKPLEGSRGQRFGDKFSDWFRLLKGESSLLAEHGEASVPVNEFCMKGLQITGR
jgi:hypothetical protein